MKVAIVGGGIAGLYTAWRMLTSKGADGADIEVVLFESSGRLGGRILSQVIPPLDFRAELGAMRFHPMTQLLLRALLDDLEIRTRPFDVAPPHLYVRGRALSPQEVLRGQCMRCRAGTPFALRANEQGKSPEELLTSVLKSLFADLSFPGASDEEARAMRGRLLEANYGQDLWVFLRKYAMYQDIPLSEIGFWNLLQHYLSNEAFQLVYHALSLESVIGNWNAAEAIPWFVADFTGADLWMVPAGMSWILECMRRAMDGHKGWQPKINHRVRECKLTNGKWAISFETTDDPTYDQFEERKETKPPKAKETGTIDGFDHVVLAVPLQAYRTIEVLTPKGGEKDHEKWSLPLDDDIVSHRLFKAFLLYEHPWWKGGDVSDGAGRIYTDLPLRQVYYFTPEWMRRCVESGEADGEWTPQWKDKFRGLRDRLLAPPKNQGGRPHQWSLVMASYSDEHHVNFWRPPRQGLEKSAIYFKSPEGMPSEDATLLEEELERIPAILRLRSRTVRKIQQQLSEIHGQTIGEPVAGVYMDWGNDDLSYGGGWHTWRVGSNADHYYACEKPAGLHLCGEAFSRDQGWIEGALRTSEHVLDQLHVPPTRTINRHLDYRVAEYVGGAVRS